jgi:ribosomal protein S18 acetylase RimI-like enzyme
VNDDPLIRRRLKTLHKPGVDELLYSHRAFLLHAMDKIYIRQATIDDVLILQDIGRQTFSETFASANTEANMQHYLAENFTIKQLTEELSHPQSDMFLACSGDRAIGYLKVNHGKAQTEIRDEAGLEIERIYVLQEFQGMQVGQLLFEKALASARQLGKAYLWLGVWEENHRAIRFYEKQGFTAFDKHIFKLGDDLQTDIMMKLPVHPGSLVI